MKIKNQRHKIIIRDNLGKVRAEKVVVNRVLNNWLDWQNYKILPLTIGQTLYPEWNDILIYDDETFERFGFFAFDTSQTITDNSTNMIWQLFTAGTSAFGDILGPDKQDRGTKTSIAESMLFEQEITSAYDGSYFTGFGYGLAPKLFVGDPFGTDNYLMAYLDLEEFNIQVFEGWLLQVVRDDLYENRWDIIDDVTCAHLRFHGVEIDTISFATDEDGNEILTTYNIEDLTLTRISAGRLEMSGFDPFLANPTPALFPSSTTYPSNETYPSDKEIQYKSCIFEMIPKTSVSTQFDPFTAKIIIRDLDLSFFEGTTTIDYTYERGEY